MKDQINFPFNCVHMYMYLRRIYSTGCADVHTVYVLEINCYTSKELSNDIYYFTFFDRRTTPPGLTRHAQKQLCFLSKFCRVISI
jgi:hypothetical protein